jgi:hypothetical protein
LQAILLSNEHPEARPRQNLEAVEVALYYDTALAIFQAAQGIAIIIGAAAGVGAFVGTIILVRRQPKGPKKKDKEVEIEGNESGGEDNGECLRDDGTIVEWWKCKNGNCGVCNAELWIEVPTGDGEALASEWYYTYRKDALKYLTASALKSRASVKVEAARKGRDHYRTWYFPLEETSIATSASVRGTQAGWRLAA